MSTFQIVMGAFGLLGGLWVIYWFITEVRKWHMRKRREESRILEKIQEIDDFLGETNEEV